MAELSWSAVGDVLPDEDGDHVRDSLFHLWFLRKLVRRTGLREQAEQVGWVWGNAAVYYGWANFEMESDHLNRVLAILDLPVERGWVDFGWMFDEHYSERSDRLLDYFTGEELGASEDDLIVTLHGETQDLDRLAEDLRDLGGPRVPVAYCRIVRGTPEEGTLAAALGREAEIDPHVALLMPNRAMESFVLYEDLFMQLVRVWERRRGTDER